MIPYFSTIDTPLEIMLYGSAILLYAAGGLIMDWAITKKPSLIKSVIWATGGVVIGVLLFWYLIGDSVGWSVAINNWMMGGSIYNWMIGR